MPNTMFICPDGYEINHGDCLKSCRMGRRCAPRPLLYAHADTRPVRDRWYSATQLLNSPKQVHLEREHNYAVSPIKGIPSLFGTAFHLLMEKYSRDIPYTDAEMYFVATVQTKYGDANFSGICDYVDYAEALSTDWKVTSKFGFEKLQKGDFSEKNYVEQQSLYKPFLFPNIPTNMVSVVYREWGARMASELDMLESYELPIIQEDEILAWLVERIEEQIAVDEGMIEPRDCTPKECWQSRDGRKRNKCAGYCGGKEVCEQYQTWKEGR